MNNQFDLRHTYWARRQRIQRRRRIMINTAGILAFVIGFPALVFGLHNYDCFTKVRFYEAYTACMADADCEPTAHHHRIFERQGVIMKGCMLDD